MLPTTSSNQTQPPMAPPPRPMQEYTVRVHSNLRRQFNVMKFNSANNVNVKDWKQACMERENNIKEYKMDDEMPKFGAGSEYGREQREEARRKKYGIQLKKYNPDDQPWILKVGGKGGKKYKGIREGGVTENSSFYIFTQKEGVIEAIPVAEWYNFAPIQRYKALSIEEAEEEFEKRNKVHNFFNVMKKKKGGEDADDEDEEKTEGKKKKKKKKDSEFKLTEMEDWSSDGEEEDSDDEDREEGTPKKKGAKAGKKKGKGAKKKKKADDDSGGEALEESDEGDFDDREVDYMTNSESSDEEPEDEKANRQMKGVEDEDGLRKLTTESGDEEEEENSEDKPKEEGEAENGAPDAAATAAAATDAKTKEKVKKEPNSSDSSESSDSDFDDDSVFQSAMFMPKGNKKNGMENSDKSSGQNKSPSKDNPKLKAIKRKALMEAAPTAKKAKLDGQTGAKLGGNKAAHEVITDEAIMRYLRRKPMTTKDLIHKFKKKVSDMSNKELALIIAETLKRIEPSSMKIKDTLYFHIKS